MLITVALAVAAAGRSLPPWRGAGTGPDLRWGWQLAPAVALAIGATVLLLPRGARAVLATAGAVAVLLAVPAGWSASWPQVVAVDLVGGVALLLAVLARPAPHLAALRTRALGGAVLLGHGLLVALAAPAGALVALGVLRRGRAGTGRPAGRPGAYRQVAGTGSAGRAARAARDRGGGDRSPRARRPGGRRRLALAAAGLPLVAALAARRHRAELIGYAVTGAVVAVTVPGLAPLVVAGDEPLALYAALAALGVAFVVRLAAVGGVSDQAARRGPAGGRRARVGPVGAVAGGRRRAGGGRRPGGPAEGADRARVALRRLEPGVVGGAHGRRRPGGASGRVGAGRAGGGRRAGRPAGPACRCRPRCRSSRRRCRCCSSRSARRGRCCRPPCCSPVWPRCCSPRWPRPARRSHRSPCRWAWCWWPPVCSGLLATRAGTLAAEGALLVAAVVGRRRGAPVRGTGRRLSRRGGRGVRVGGDRPAGRRAAGAGRRVPAAGGGRAGAGCRRRDHPGAGPARAGAGRCRAGGGAGGGGAHRRGGATPRHGLRALGCRRGAAAAAPG